MNTNPPKDDTVLEPNMPVIINIQKGIGKGIIRTCTGKKFPVTIKSSLLEGIQLMDYVTIRKSKVTGEWIVTDYFVNSEIYNDDYYEEVVV